MLITLHIQLSWEQQYVLTKGHAARRNVTYQPTLVLHLLFIPGQWSLIDCPYCPLLRYTSDANVTSYSSVRLCYYMTRLRCAVFKIHEEHRLRRDYTRLRYVSSLGFKGQTTFPVILWPPRCKIQEVLGGNKFYRVRVAFSNTYNQSNVLFHRIYEGWNFNFGNAAVTFDTLHLQSSYFHRPSMYSPKLCRTRSQR